MAAGGRVGGRGFFWRAATGGRRLDHCRRGFASGGSARRARRSVHWASV